MLSAVFTLLISCSAMPDSLVVNTSLLTQNGSNRATAYHDSDKVVDTKEYLFVTFLEYISGSEIVTVKRFNKETSSWDQSYSFKNIKDNHGGASLVMDSKGFLHIIYGSHNSPLKYSYSVKPYDINNWKVPQLLSGNYTYPSMVINDKDELFLVARVDKRKSNWSLALLTKKPSQSLWSKPKTILNSNYQNWRNKSFKESDFSVSNGYVRFGKYLSIDEKGILHITLQYFEYVPRGVKTFSKNSKNTSTYLVGHIYSDDGGKTWIGRNSSPISSTLAIKDITLINGADTPENAKSNFSSGQHIVHNQKIYFLYSKSFGDSWKFYIASSSFPYTSWQEQEVRHPKYYLRSPAAISIYDDKLYFSANALPRLVADNRKGKFLPDYNRVVTGYTSLEGNSPINYITYDTISLPSWLPHLSKNGSNLWSMFTQGKRDANGSKVYIYKVK